MRVVIAGCGRVGSTLAAQLSSEGHDITVIDKSRDALDRLGKAFNGATVQGEAFDVDVLSKSGIELADVFVAVTDSDNANLMATEVAKLVFGVPRAISRLYDAAREDSYRALDIDFVTGTKLMAKVIAERVVDREFRYHVTWDSDVEIVEFTVAEAANNKTIGDLQVRNRLRVAAVQRAGQSFVPDDKFRLRTGDLVVAAARQGVRQRIKKFVKDDGYESSRS